MSDRKEFRDLAEPAAAREAIASLDLSPAPNVSRARSSST